MVGLGLFLPILSWIFSDILRYDCDSGHTGIEMQLSLLLAIIIHAKLVASRDWTLFDTNDRKPPIPPTLIQTYYPYTNLLATSRTSLSTYLTTYRTAYLSTYRTYKPPTYNS